MSCVEEASSVKVHFLDNRWMKCDVNVEAKIGELRALVCARLRLPERDSICFELFVFASNGRRFVVSREKLISSVSQKLVFAVSRITKALARVRQRRNTLRLLYADAVYRVITGEYFCDAHEAPLLAAMQLRVSGATDSDGLSRLITEHLKEIVPWPLLMKKSDQYWQQRVLSAFRHDKSITDIDAQRARYLDFVQRWTWYGSELFECAQLALFDVSDSFSFRTTTTTTIKKNKPIAKIDTAGLTALAISNQGLFLFICTAMKQQISSFFSRFYDQSLSSSFFFQLADLDKWGHHDQEFFVQIPAATRTALLELLRPVATTLKKNGKQTTPSFRKPKKSSGLVLYCIIRNAAACAKLLHDFALAHIQQCEDKESNTNDDSTTSDQESMQEVQTTTSTDMNSRHLTSSLKKAISSPRINRLRSENSAVSNIASRWRGAYLRIQWRKQEAVILIQSHWRSALCRILFKREEAVILIQSVARGYIVRRRRKARFYSDNGRVFKYSFKCTTSLRTPRPPPTSKRRPDFWAVAIQCHWRGYHVRRDLAYFDQEIAAIQIQALIRAYLQRTEI